MNKFIYVRKSLHINNLSKLFFSIFKNKQELFLFIIILLLFVFFRTYEFEVRHQFGWDQVDNAWVSKNIWVNHELPLVGMQARQSSGVFIGPLYYYYIAAFYLLTSLDPIASPIAALFTSIFSFLVLFFVSKKIFNTKVALLSIFIEAVSFHVIVYDRLQWPVAFIAPISLLFFYFLYKILKGEAKNLIFLGIILGFSLHVHTTSLFYFFILLFSLPFFPKQKETIKYGIISFFLFFLFLIPNIVSIFTSKNVNSPVSFFSTSYHGLHLRRVIQLTGDAFIEFESITKFGILKFVSILIVPIFSLVYLKERLTKERVVFVYLVILWFVVPWFVIATYRGDISNYFFSSTRFIAIIIMSYFVIKIWELKTIFPKIAVSLIIIYFSYINVQAYFNYKSQGLYHFKVEAKDEVERGEKNTFLYGAPESYLHYIYGKKWGK